MSILRTVLAWLIGFALVLTRWSCRKRRYGDSRAALREAGQPYAYAILHCHQIGAVIGREPGTGAMVSRSRDGALLVPSLRLNGIVPYRGSGRGKDATKGGEAALAGLIEHVRGGRPAYLAVDGPRGPRNYVNFGIAKLAMETGAAVLVAIPVPRRRWILRRTWDRFQIPKPFTRVDMYFGEPITVRPGEDLGAFRQRVEDALIALEELHDPEEAAAGKIVAEKRRARFAREAAEKAKAAGRPEAAATGHMAGRITGDEAGDGQAC